MSRKSLACCASANEEALGRRAGPRGVVVVAHSSAMSSSSALRSIPPDSRSRRRRSTGHAPVARRPPERDDLGCGAREAVMTRDAYCLVVNPGARGRGMRRLPAVLGPLAAAGAQVRVEESSSLGHAATLAAEAAERDETVVAVGGDGTIGAMAAAVS